MGTAIVTGAGGLIGSESVDFLCDLGFDVIGIDNDMRQVFFGESASTRWRVEQLRAAHRNYTHLDCDIRDAGAIEAAVRRVGRDLLLLIHTAAQPSHDWAATDPPTDFSVNATGTLVLLEAVRHHAPDAVFVFTSTNKVYGDRPNSLPLVEGETRWELPPDHEYFAEGVPETMSIDASKHSLFGVSKVAADLLVQEYGVYFGLRTASFRGGCLTGPSHSGAELHGFLAYLMHCTITGRRYNIYGYKGKQVRDNIHSRDVVRAFYEFFQAPESGRVYNIGGGRASSCSVLEAIAHCERIAGRPLDHRYVDDARSGDHMWWISDMTRFRSDYPAWDTMFDLEDTLTGIYLNQTSRRATQPTSTGAHGG